MSLINDFNNLLKTLAADRKMLKIFFVVICVLLVAGYFITPLFVKKKVENIDQCDYLKEQNKQLVGALLEIRKGLSEMAAPTSFRGAGNGISFASFIDTTKRPLNNNQMQQRIQTLLMKVDSVLLQRRIDSLRRIKAII